MADFLSHLGKWVELIKSEAENECFCTWKVEKPQDFYSEIQEMTQILLRISEEKFGGLGLCLSYFMCMYKCFNQLFVLTSSTQVCNVLEKTTAIFNCNYIRLIK